MEGLNFMSERRIIPVKLDNYKPLRDIVFESLREAILNQVLQPGERLMEIQLAEEMGVSRTPVREAIRKLELEGFVIIIPRKGAYVSQISLKDIHELYEIRANLESLACSLAAERATPDEIEEMEKLLVIENEALDKLDLETEEINIDIHDLIYKSARNERLLSILNNLREQIHRTKLAHMAEPEKRKTSLEEHRKIVESIGERNIELAQRLGEEHIEQAEQAMIEHLKEKYDIS